MPEYVDRLDSESQDQLCQNLSLLSLLVVLQCRNPTRKESQGISQVLQGGLYGTLGNQLTELYSLRLNVAPAALGIQ